MVQKSWNERGGGMVCPVLLSYTNFSDRTARWRFPAGKREKRYQLEKKNTYLQNGTEELGGIGR